MQNVIDKLQFAFAALGGFLGWFFGGFDGFLYALIVFVVTDYFTGILAAGIRKELSSEVGFKGIAKKVCIFLLVGMANVIDTQVLQNGAAIRTAVIFFYLSNEGLSILENSAVIGIPIPEKLKDMLIQLTNEKHVPEKNDEKRRVTIQLFAIFIVLYERKIWRTGYQMLNFSKHNERSFLKSTSPKPKKSCAL